MIPIDRVVADRPYYSGKRKRHGVNMQVLANSKRRPLWASPAAAAAAVATPRRTGPAAPGGPVAEQGERTSLWGDPHRVEPAAAAVDRTAEHRRVCALFAVYLAEQPELVADACRAIGGQNLAYGCPNCPATSTCGSPSCTADRPASLVYSASRPVRPMTSSGYGRSLVLRISAATVASAMMAFERVYSNVAPRRTFAP